MSAAFCSNNLNERPRSQIRKSCARTAGKLHSVTGSIPSTRREHIDPCPVQSVGISLHQPWVSSRIRRCVPDSRIGLRSAIHAHQKDPVRLKFAATPMAAAAHLTSTPLQQPASHRRRHQFRSILLQEVAGAGTAQPGTDPQDRMLAQARTIKCIMRHYPAAILPSGT